MKKRVITILTAMVMIVAMSISALGAGGDGIGFDDMPSNITIPNSSLSGNYQTGKEMEFVVQIWASGDYGKVNARKEVQIVKGDGTSAASAISGFKFQDDDKKWKDAKQYNATILLKNKTNKMRVTFLKAGKYKIIATLTKKSGEKVSCTRSIEVTGKDIKAPAETKTTTKETKIEKTKVTKATKKKSSKSAKITLKKVKGAKKYQIQIANSKKFSKKNIFVKKTVKKASFTVKSKKIRNRKKLYVRARAKVNGKYIAWSKAKKMKIRK